MQGNREGSEGIEGIGKRTKVGFVLERVRNAHERERKERGSNGGKDRI